MKSAVLSLVVYITTLERQPDTYSSPVCVLSYALNLFIRLYRLLPLGVTVLLGAASLFEMVFK